MRSLRRWDTSVTCRKPQREQVWLLGKLKSCVVFMHSFLCMGRFSISRCWSLKDMEYEELGRKVGALLYE